MTALTRRLLAYVVAGAIAAALLFYIFGRLDSYFGAQDRAITEASQQQLALHPALVRMRAKYLAVERHNAQLAASRGAWADSARILALALDSADSAARAIAGQPVALPSPWRAIADSERAGRAACSVALLACQRRAESAEAEADSLHRRLAAQVTVKPKRCWIALGGGVAAGQGAAWGATLSASCGLLRIPFLP